MFDPQSASKSHPFDEILGRLSIGYSNDDIHRNGSYIGIPVLFPIFGGFLFWKIYTYTIELDLSIFRIMFQVNVWIYDICIVL